MDRNTMKKCFLFTHHPSYMREWWVLVLSGVCRRIPLIFPCWLWMGITVPVRRENSTCSRVSLVQTREPFQEHQLNQKSKWLLSWSDPKRPWRKMHVSPWLLGQQSPWMMMQQAKQHSSSVDIKKNLKDPGLLLTLCCWWGRSANV